MAGIRGPTPDGAWIHAERRKPGVTLELLHLEYLERNPDGYRYTQFCELYRRWLARRGLSMHKVHHAGEKMFVDYAGQKPRLVGATLLDGLTGPRCGVPEAPAAIYLRTRDAKSVRRLRARDVAGG